MVLDKKEKEEGVMFTCFNTSVVHTELTSTLSKRSVWPAGKVILTTPGCDGRVRTVEIATKGGIFRRPVNKLVVLVSQLTPK